MGAKSETPDHLRDRAFVLTGWYGNLPQNKMAPQESPVSNHSLIEHPPAALGPARLTCSTGVSVAGLARTASRSPPESPWASAPDAWFDHAAGMVIVRKTCRLPMTAACRGGVGH